jgi:hypothetical protein
MQSRIGRYEISAEQWTLGAGQYRQLCRPRASGTWPGLQPSVREGATGQGWGGRPVRQEQL